MSSKAPSRETARSSAGSPCSFFAARKGQIAGIGRYVAHTSVPSLRQRDAVFQEFGVFYVRQIWYNYTDAINPMFRSGPENLSVITASNRFPNRENRASLLISVPVSSCRDKRMFTSFLHNMYKRRAFAAFGCPECPLQARFSAKTWNSSNYGENR